jgi:hypothetical protein
VLLFPISLLLGVLAGIAAGGRPGSLTQLRLRAPGIVVGALALQSLLALHGAGEMPAAAHVTLLAVSYAAAGAWLVVNIPRRSRVLAVGLAVTGLGWLSNMVVVLANSGMPVSVSALARIGASPALLAGGGPLGKHLEQSSGAVLAFLGDTIPMPALNSVVSIGDLVMMAGMVCAVAAAMRVPRAAAPNPAAAARPVAA